MALGCDCDVDHLSRYNIGLQGCARSDERHTLSVLALCQNASMAKIYTRPEPGVYGEIYTRTRVPVYPYLFIN